MGCWNSNHGGGDVQGFPGAQPGRQSMHTQLQPRVPNPVNSPMSCKQCWVLGQRFQMMVFIRTLELIKYTHLWAPLSDLPESKSKNIWFCRDLLGLPVEFILTLSVSYWAWFSPWSLLSIPSVPGSGPHPVESTELFEPWAQPSNSSKTWKEKDDFRSEFQEIKLWLSPRNAVRTQWMDTLEGLWDHRRASASLCHPVAKRIAKCGTDLEPGFQLALKGKQCLIVSAELVCWQHPRENLLHGGGVLYIDVWSRYDKQWRERAGDFSLAQPLDHVWKLWSGGCLRELMQLFSKGLKQSCSGAKWQVFYRVEEACISPLLGFRGDSGGHHGGFRWNSGWEQGRLWCQAVDAMPGGKVETWKLGGRQPMPGDYGQLP